MIFNSLFFTHRGQKISYRNPWFLILWIKKGINKDYIVGEW